LAIIGPSFFYYVQAVVEEFRRRGIEAVEFDERHSNRAIDKVIYRLRLDHGAFSPKRKHLARILDEIRTARSTDVLLISVEVVDRDFVSRLIADGVRVHLYLWDGVANKPRITSLFDLVSNKGTFDPVDSKTFDMPYIPLFAEATFDAERLQPEGYDYDIGFCGTMHSSRSAILAELLSAPWAKRLRLALMLYYQSRVLLWVRGVADWNVWRLMSRISTTSYPKAQVAEMVAKSRFVLDVPHPGQSGMTARTFEVLLAGSRLLTFNRIAADLLPTSLRPRVRVIGKISEAAEIDFASCQRLPALTPDERYFLSLRRFVDQLMAMMNMRPASDQADRQTSRLASDRLPF